MLVLGPFMQSKQKGERKSKWIELTREKRKGRQEREEKKKRKWLLHKYDAGASVLFIRFGYNFNMFSINLERRPDLERLGGKSTLSSRWIFINTLASPPENLLEAKLLVVQI